ncbi:ABC transporter permease [Paenibacillus radicis (ex Xue et al. 2023)]|uniref:ABC transporter permease subunit n=1 Tax=Paenibacillus radicis (ex Xue et al. 2023) TaxID=2972489 RepID=A0ABT1YHR8_9BACL|nr:ABC transporter permease subunit [Paenibacillus radicis (ex Xue et al. 2023)]MCR8632255.1 ABC transporter permease subunit [Paenibacillus radicis (ex Xue et al. 2023)]
MKATALEQSSTPSKLSRKSKWVAWNKIRKGWQLYLMILLPVLYILIFKYIPMMDAQIAFRNYVFTKGIWGSDWVGFDNFMRFFQSSEFAKVLKNTLGLSIYQLIAGFPFPILLAISLNYVGSERYKKWVQMITYAPHFISVVVIVGIIMQLLDPRTGLVNVLIQSLGLEPIHFMGEARYFQSLVVWSGLWQNLGFSCIIYIAGLAGIDPLLHEAAVVDGASKFRRAWHIDLPGIMPLAIILLILNTGNLLDTGFEKVLLMQNPLNIKTSEVIDTLVYKIGLASPAADFSYSTAIGLFKSVVGLLLLVSVNQLARKFKQESLW